MTAPHRSLRARAGEVARALLVRTRALRRPGRPRSLVELRPEVTALALAGVSAAEIARRTGLAHDAVGLILHLAVPSRQEISAGLGTMYRPEPDPRAVAARA
jgi:hypothetical protein